MRQTAVEKNRNLRRHLVTDQVPLLLIVVLPEEAGFVGRQVHRILGEIKNKDWFNS